MIDLPDYPSPNGADLAVQDFGTMLTPALGGPVQRVNRMGNRFRGSFTLPPMTTKTARAWQAALVQGVGEGVRMPYPLLDFDPGVPGTVLVDGSGQAGMSLAVKGATPGYAFRRGQVFSILTGGKHHLYMAASEVIAGASGNATLPLPIMLRRQHLDGDACYFTEPMIEGFVSADAAAWSMSVDHLIGMQFDIVESQ
jgi:hypothetical protein